MSDSEMDSSNASNDVVVGPTQPSSKVGMIRNKRKRSDEADLLSSSSEDDAEEEQLSGVIKDSQEGLKVSSQSSSRSSSQGSSVQILKDTRDDYDVIISSGTTPSSAQVSSSVKKHNDFCDHEASDLSSSFQNSKADNTNTIDDIDPRRDVIPTTLCKVDRDGNGDLEMEKIAARIDEDDPTTYQSFCAHSSKSPPEDPPGTPQGSSRSRRSRSAGRSVQATQPGASRYPT